MLGKGRRLPDPNRPANNEVYPFLKVSEKLFKTPEELIEKIQEFFDECKDHQEEVMSASGVIKYVSRPMMPTVHALSSYLGIQMQTLSDYEKKEGYEPFHHVVKMAKEYIYGMKTLGLINGKGATQGLIFDLKNNHNWKDKVEVESDNRNEHIIKIEYDKS